MSDRKKGNIHSELFNKRGETITVEAPIVIFEQDGNTIYFSPLLEVYGYGKDNDEAQKSWHKSLEIFINYTLNKHTFSKEMARLGWVYKKRRKQYTAPSFSKMLIKNEKLIDIFDNHEATVGREKFALPVE